MERREGDQDARLVLVILLVLVIDRSGGAAARGGITSMITITITSTKRRWRGVVTRQNFTVAVARIVRPGPGMTWPL